MNQEESEQNEADGTKKGACTVYSGSDNAQCVMAQWRSVNNNGLRTTCESDGGIHFVIVLTYETRSIASCVLSPSSQNVRATNVFTSADELLTNTYNLNTHLHKCMARHTRLKTKSSKASY